MHKAFITNTSTKTLKKRLTELIEHSKELKFLVGFFYFSGWQEIYQVLENRDDLAVKVLVGLDVDKLLGKVIEIADDDNNNSGRDKINRFFDSLSFALNNQQMDNEEFYEQVELFIRLIEQDRLIIRKTAEPNHAKLYIFKIKDQLKGIADIKFITGSSNLTRAGILEQNEFNVEIGDYGTDQAEEYFDRLWESAIKITELPEYKHQLIDFIRNRSQAATVSPFEAYMLVLKTYLELMEQKQVRPRVVRLLEKNGYKAYQYQRDAVNQALSTIESYGGVIIADVVGLGKTIIACMIAAHLGKRGMVICPPGLMGDRNAKSGWRKYLHDFQLHSWELRSSGDLEKTAEYIKQYGDDIEIIIIDEAHRFRNQDTQDYEYLSNICRNRIVILLTATPFNNTPQDIFSLLKLFIVPGRSAITLNENLEARFSHYNQLFKRLSYIVKNHNSAEEKKRRRAERYYQELFGELPINLIKVKHYSKELARQIRRVIEPVLIRRNRLDLKNDPIYSKEITDLPTIEDPQKLYFDLTPQQSEFYDRVIGEFFGKNGRFTGAIYQPFLYEKGLNPDEIAFNNDTEQGAKKLDEEGNRTFLQQRNLYDFMRRLLVKRFESSFGAFYQSICNFEEIHTIVLKFIRNSDGKYILDRDLIRKIYQDDEEEIKSALEKFKERLKQEKRIPRHEQIYDINKFADKDKFIKHIEADLQLMREIKLQIEKLKLVENDPKANALIKEIRKILTTLPANNEPYCKIVVFTEYADTVEHLKPFLNENFPEQVLYVQGDLSANKIKQLLTNFDASVKSEHQDDTFKVLMTTDKISEGFNLNRAGAIINYDIPWNPTRVIQRVGRINRIGQKVFEKLYIYNFFPTEQGSDIIKSEQIAAQKMFLIHNTLGEDAKIFDIDETPEASTLFRRINQYIEDQEDESLLTGIRKIYLNAKERYPDIIKRISHLPARIKTAKAYKENQLIVFRKKGLALFIHYVQDTNSDTPKIVPVLFEEILPYIKCDKNQERLELSKHFWKCYEQVKVHKEHFRKPHSEISLDKRAHNNLQSALQYYRTRLGQYEPFVITLLKDLREYKTLSQYTLRRLAVVSLEPGKNEQLKDFLKEVEFVQSHLGDDYLERVEQHISSLQPEIIVAIENRVVPEQ